MSSRVRNVQTLNKGNFTSMSEFELKKRDNGKTTLGTGSFGAVHLTTHVKSNQTYAVKIIQGSNITTPYEQEGIEREIKVHFRCQHPNIVKLYDSFQENDAVYMVMEYVPNGNLYNYVQRKKRLDDKEACKYFVQTCEALQYLHDSNVFHRDIKPENLLLDANNNIKVCDFGWCAENIHLKRKTFCGTYEYMAPEIVTDVAYDYTIDIWSVGVLLYELLHGYAPFKGKEFKEISANIKSGIIKYSSAVCQDAQDLISMILQKDPALRPSFSTIFKSNFVQKNYNQSQIFKNHSLKIETISSPRFSSDNTENLSKYQSPLQNHQPKGRVQLISDKKSPNQSSSNIKQIVDVKKPVSFVASHSEVKPLQKRSLLQNNYEDIKKRINFDSTPLKDTTTNFQNLLLSSKHNNPDDNQISQRKKNQSMNTFFCASAQNSSSKPIFNKDKGSEKKPAPKSSLIISQPNLFKSQKASSDIKKVTYTNQPSVKTSPITKINLKSKNYTASFQDENFCRDLGKKTSLISNKSSARKETRPFVDQYKSLPSENTIDKTKDENLYDEPQTFVSLMTERVQKLVGLHHQQESKNEFDKILKMYMSLTNDKK